MLSSKLLRSGLSLAAVFALCAAARPIERAGTLAVRAVSGKTTTACAKCEDGTNRHAFTGLGAFFDCESCNACHENWQTGWCGNYHCGCGGESEEFAGSGELTFAYLESVVSHGNANVLENYIARHPSRLVRNGRRNVVQLLGCDAQVIAQFPIPLDQRIVGD